jgi:hypothetical protein
LKRNKLSELSHSPFKELPVFTFPEAKDKSAVIKAGKFN